MPPYFLPVQLAQGGTAAAADAASARPAEIPPFTAAQAFERASAAPRAREAELREAQRQLAIANISSEEGWAEVRRLEFHNAGWRQRQKEQEAKDDAQEAELRELSCILTECEDKLSLAKALLRSFLER